MNFQIVEGIFILLFLENVNKTCNRETSFLTMDALQFRTSVLTAPFTILKWKQDKEKQELCNSKVTAFSPLAKKENLTTASYYRGWIFIK